MLIRCLLLLLIAAAPAVPQSLEFKKLIKDTSTEGSSPKTALKLSNPLIGENGRIYACSGRNLFAFESNGTVAWIIPLKYLCSVDIVPVDDGRGKIYLIAEDRVLKITPSNIGTSISTVEIFFGPNSTVGGSGEIIGISVSICVGPMLYRFGFRQGCKKDITGCYFTSSPIVDQCEGTLYITNTEGQLYSLYIRSPNFRWIQDFGSIDKLLTVTPGNNGRLYIIFPRKSLVMALDSSSGNVLWQNNVGPLSTEYSMPAVDSNGWISIGSLDGLLYTFSPSGDLRTFLEKSAPDSVIQASPVLDCSGFAVYISQMVMESKSSHIIDNYTYISAMTPINMVFTLMAPATGTVYWTGKYPGELSSLLSKSDLCYFSIDERILLTFLASEGIGNTLPCYTTSQKIEWTCSQANPKYVNIYTGNERAILLFIVFQFIILVLLAGCVRFCCIFWRKKKLQDHGLGRFLEKRRSLHSKRRTFSRMISELEQKAAVDATTNESLEELREIVKAKEGAERKLSTSYSLGRDRTGSQRGSILPLYSGKTKTHSFSSSRKESVSVFSMLSDTSTSGEKRTSSDEGSESASSSRRGEQWHSCGDVELSVKSKAEIETWHPNSAIISEREWGEGPSDTSLFRNPTLMENQNEGSGSMYRGEEELVLQPLQDRMGRRMWLKRRTLSSTN